MPVLVNSQPSNANAAEQQEQIYSPEDNSLIDGQENHTPSHEPQVDLLRILDEPGQTNGDIFGLTSQTASTLNPLEDLLFGTGAPTTNHSHEGNDRLALEHHRQPAVSPQ